MVLIWTVINLPIFDLTFNLRHCIGLISFLEEHKKKRSTKLCEEEKQQTQEVARRLFVSSFFEKKFLDILN